MLCRVAFANMLLGLERYTLKEGSAPRTLTKGFKDVREHWYQAVQCTWNVFDSSLRLGPNLTNWQTPTSPRKLGSGRCSFWQGAHGEKAQGRRVVVGLANQTPVRCARGACGDGAVES
jgi:hypothetical protein